MKKKDISASQDMLFSAPQGAEAEPGKDAPLAVRMRPRTIDEVIGQAQILGEGKLLRRVIQADRITSMIFYGPPGSGKTTLARVISKATKSRFVPLNAVMANVADLRRVIEEAASYRRQQGLRTILFVDEIHRFSKSQQDVLMPDVEEGNIILIGATTQNPTFAINAPLISRAQLFELKPLTEEEVVKLLKSAIADKERGYGNLNVSADEDALLHIARQSHGDGRRALGALEIGALSTPVNGKGEIHLDLAAAEESCQKRMVYYDKDGDYHYDTASALIKSMRASDSEGAMYWAAKMLHAGEEPRFIIRRILIFASEDVGLADPKALLLAAAGLQAIEFVGLPEAEIILGHLVAYMASAKKSRDSYEALRRSQEKVSREAGKEVPQNLKNLK